MDAGIVDLICHYDSPLGGITLAGSGDSLTGLWLAGQTHFAATLNGRCEEGWIPVFDDAFRWLDSYFGGYVPSLTPRLDLRGTSFQRTVWRALLDIPYGTTVTYGDIARWLNSSPRAVGGAVGRNPVSLIVPCHRVVGAGGRLTGYAGGLELKARLLELERTGNLSPWTR
ncbi:MAG: methylated-DNA--[Bacteroidales bacterium]|nr:methylated-DNA--[protein]-cysteine S-methyltransferase [Bacteroidales bacterium]